MSIYWNERNETPKVAPILIHVGIFILIITCLGMWGCPRWNVYQKRLEGQAQLAHAQSAKEVAVAEAKAKMESSELLAKAEVLRAEGVAKANKIIGESLHNNEAYLRYLWITDVAGAGQQKTVVYIPTEANLPILEATRNKEQK
jgi:regulator of protease activity HflC (stomatin/prohibitin superfamily)